MQIELSPHEAYLLIDAIKTDMESMVGLNDDDSSIASYCHVMSKIIQKILDAAGEPEINPWNKEELELLRGQK